MTSTKAKQSQARVLEAQASPTNRTGGLQSEFAAKIGFHKQPVAKGKRRSGICLICTQRPLSRVQTKRYWTCKFPFLFLRVVHSKVVKNKKHLQHIAFLLTVSPFWVSLVFPPNQQNVWFEHMFEKIEGQASHAKPHGVVCLGIGKLDICAEMFISPKQTKRARDL